MSAARFVPAWSAADAVGPVVVIDVLRAFTTAAYAFGAGACRIWLVRSVDEALAIKAGRPGTLANAFGFAMEARRGADGLELTARPG